MKGAWNFDALAGRLTAAGKSAVSAVGKVSEAVATEVVHGVVGAKCLLNYNLEQTPVASCGPVWSIYLARSKKEGAANPFVSVWVLDKRLLLSMSGGDRNASRRVDALIDLTKNNVQHLTRLKHPSILRLISPVEETRAQLVFLTEPCFSSLDDVLHVGEHLPGRIQQQLRELKLSELEIKHGLLQISDGLTFLHNDAGIVHRGISPQSIIITRSGAWKLAAFDFAIPIDVGASRSFRNGFDYSDQHASVLGVALQPPLSYLAPELVATGQDVPVLPSSDVFAVAAVAYELIAGHPLLPTACSLIDYESRIRSLALTDLGDAPLGLQQMLRQMLAPAPEARPPIASFSGCPFFMSDIQLRALKFLDSMVQKSIDQRAIFLNDLPNLAAQFDRRVLLYSVLPPLLQELRTKELQGTALPIVMKIIKIQSSEEFADVSLPALKPLLDNATGEMLVQLTQAASLFQSATSGKGGAVQLVPKLLVRSLQSEDARCQEEALRQVPSLSQAMDYEALKKEVLPAVHATCLSTTSASVRVEAFKTLAAVSARVDVAEAGQMLTTATTCVAFDKSAPTAMCVLGLGEVLAKKWGPILAAERVLPAIAPLLVVPTLSASQFHTAAKTVRDIVSLVEKSRGANTSDGGGGGGISSGGGAVRKKENTAAGGGGGDGNDVSVLSWDTPPAPLSVAASLTMQQQQPPFRGRKEENSGADPFAWPPPPQQQQQQQQQQHGIPSSSSVVGNSSSSSTSNNKVAPTDPLAALFSTGHPPSQSSSMMTAMNSKNSATSELDDIFGLGTLQQQQQQSSSSSPLKGKSTAAQPLSLI